MKLPALLAALLFIILAIPKVLLGVSYFHLGGWNEAKSIFSWLFMDFLFTWAIAWVIWLQMGKRAWPAFGSFCAASALATLFWITPFSEAPSSFREHVAFLYPDKHNSQAEPQLPKPSDDDWLTRYKAMLPEETNYTESKLALTPEEEIQETFDALLRALKTRDVAKVRLLSDKNTLQYFDQLRDMVWSADRASLEKLKPIDRLQVLVYRHILMHQDEARRNITSEALFTQAIEQGWFYVGDSPDVRVDYIDLIPGGTEAHSDIIINSIIPEERMDFYKEGGMWKCNLLKLLPSQQEKLLANMHQQALSEQEFLKEMLHRQTGTPMDSSVWTPLSEVH